MESGHQYLAIEGNIGSGKTTLANMLAGRLNANLILEEFADNPFLPDFYENPARYGFALELSFLADRYHQLNNLLHDGDLFRPITVSDYFLSKSLIFAQVTLKDEELKLFNNLYRIMYRNLPKPNSIVYLHAPVEELKKRISSRGRVYEQKIQAEYLQKIQEHYFGFFRQQPGLRVLIVDTTGVDIRGDHPGVEQLWRRIEKGLKRGLNYMELHKARK